MVFLNNCWFKMSQSLISEWNEWNLYLKIYFLRGSRGSWGRGSKRCWHNLRMDGYLMMMLDYKGGRQWSRIWEKVITWNVLVLYDISAERYLNFKFIIIKIIMYSSCSITSLKHLWLIFKNILSFSWNGNGNKRH